MSIIQRALAAIMSTEPPEKQPIFWPFWLIIGSGSLITAGDLAPLHWLGNVMLFSGCALTLRNISFNGLA